VFIGWSPDNHHKELLDQLYTRDAKNIFRTIDYGIYRSGYVLYSQTQKKNIKSNTREEWRR